MANDDVLVAGGDDGLSVWKLRKQADGTLATNSQTRFTDGRRVCSVAFSHDTLQLARGNDGSASMCDPHALGSATGRQRDFKCAGAAVNVVAFSHDDTLLATGDVAGKARLWRVDDQKACAEHQCGGSVMSIAFSSDDMLVATASKGGERHKGLAVWQPNRQGGPRQWAAVGEGTALPDGAARSVAFSHDSTRLAAGWTSGEVSVWLAEMDTGKSVAWSGDCAAAAAITATAVVFSRAWRGDCGASVCSVAFSRASESGSLALASGDERGTVTVWGGAGERLQEMSLANPVHAVAFALGSPLLATASGCFVTVWAAAEGSWLVLGGTSKPVSELVCAKSVQSVAFSTAPRLQYKEAEVEPPAVKKSADESLGALHVLYGDDVYDGASSEDELTQTCSRGDVQKLTTLQKRGIDAQALDNRGRSALATAAYHGHQDLLKKLLDTVDDPNHLDAGGRPPLQLAAYGVDSHNSVANLLLHPKTNPNVQLRAGVPLLLLVAQSGRVNAMRALLADMRTMVDVQREEDGLTPLQKAAETGEVEGVKLLHDRSDVSLCDHRGQTALHYAVMSGSAEVLEMLCASATPELLNQKTNDTKATALLSAVSCSHADSVRVLLRHKADATLEDDHGRTALQVAYRGQNAELVGILLEALLEQTQEGGSEQDDAFSCLDRSYGTALAHLLRSDVEKARRSRGWDGLLADHNALPREVVAALECRPTKSRSAGMPHGRMSLGNAFETKGADVCFGPGPNLLPSEVFLSIAAAHGSADADKIATVCPPALTGLVAQALEAPLHAIGGRIQLFLERGLDAGLADGVGRDDEAADTIFKPLLLQHCGSVAGVTRFLQDTEAFTQLKERCMARLELIARPLESLCEEQGLTKRLGSIGKRFFGTSIAQDEKDMLPVPTFINGEKQDSDFFERALIRLIWMVSVAVDGSFFAALRAALEPFGDKSTEGDEGHVTISSGGVDVIVLRKAPIKGIARMQNKLKEDHATKPQPRPKWNIDPVRHGVVVFDINLVEKVFNAIGKVGRYLRVKNGFAPDQPASYGYRAILCNLRHAPTGVRVADVFGEVQWPLWKQLGEELDSTGSVTEQIQHCLSALSQPALEKAPLAIVAEVQLIYGPFFKLGRERSHRHYRVVRCGSATELIHDACKRKLAASAAERQLRQLVEQLTGAAASREQVPQMKFKCITNGKLKAHKQRIFALAYEPSKKLLFSAGEEKNILGWRIEAGRPSPVKATAPLTHKDRISSLACTDGVLFSGCKNGAMKAWDLDVSFCGAMGRQFYPLAGHEAGGGVDALVFATTPQGGLLCSASYDCTIRLWRAGPRAEAQASYRPDDGSIANTLAAEWGNAVCVAVLAEAGAEAVLTLTLSADGLTLFSGGWRGSICVWSTAAATSEAKPLETLPAQPSVSTSATNYVVALAADSQHKLLYVGSEDGALRVWRRADGGTSAHSCVATLKGHQKEVARLMLLPDSRCLCSGSADGTVRLWQLLGTPCDDGAFSCVATLQEGNGPMTALAAVTLPSGGVAICGAKVLLKGRRKKVEDHVIDLWLPTGAGSGGKAWRRLRTKLSAVGMMAGPRGLARVWPQPSDTSKSTL